jgi:hypothetical protein
MTDTRVNAAITAIRAALADHELALVLGAGISAAATTRRDMTTWTKLVKNAIAQSVNLHNRDQAWAERAEADVDSQYDDDLIAAAEKATSGLGGRTSWQYSEWLRDTAGSLHIENSALTDVIKRYGERGSLLATTNYDSIAAEATGWRIVTWRDNTTIQRVYRGADRAIIHLHGHWAQPDTVVFGSSSYADVLSDPHAVEFLRMMMWGKTVVFCGFGAGLRDPNFTALRNWVKTYTGSQYSHYRLVRDDDADKAEREHDRDEHIIVVPFGPNHEDLGAFLSAVLTGTQETLHPPTSLGPQPQQSRDAAPVSRATRDQLRQVAARLATVTAIATAPAHSELAPEDHALDPAVRDAYIRFHNAFEDETALVARVASGAQLTQPQAQRALGMGTRLIALLDDQRI